MKVLVRSIRLVAARLSAAVAVAALVIVAGTAGALAATPGSGSSSGTAATYKALHDTDPHLALSSAAQAHLQQKQQAAASYFRIDTCCNRIANSINVIEEDQGTTSTNKYYFCGPASLDEAVTYKGYGMGQDAAATLLKTDSNGTAWSGVYIGKGNNTGYPIPDALNYQAGLGSYYLPVAVPYTPTQTDINNYEFAIKYDIDGAYPVVGDAWEVAGYAHLWNHPTNQTIFHWFDIKGYANSAATTTYVDSAHSVWSAVQPYNVGFDTPTLVLIVGGRGYVW